MANSCEEKGTVSARPLVSGIICPRRETSVNQTKKDLIQRYYVAEIIISIAAGKEQYLIFLSELLKQGHRFLYSFRMEVDKGVIQQDRRSLPFRN